MERWNTHFSTRVELDCFEQKWFFQQNPSSEHLGTSVWDASIVAAKFFEKSSLSRRGDFTRDKMAGKRAIELGAGMGVGSVALAMMGCHVDCTDVGEVMPLLRNNVEMNLSRSSLPSSPFSGGVGKVRVEELDWLKRDEHLKKFSPPYDFLLATDCVYHEELIEDLMATILPLINKKTVVLIANEFRSKSVHSRWMEICKEHFSIKRVPQDRLHPDFCHESIELFVMKLNKSSRGKKDAGEGEAEAEAEPGAEAASGTGRESLEEGRGGASQSSGPIGGAGGAGQTGETAEAGAGQAGGSADGTDVDDALASAAGRAGEGVREFEGGGEATGTGTGAGGAAAGVVGHFGALNLER